MEKETIELLTKRYGYSYIMPTVCSVGIMCNIINLSVLTNRRLKESPYTYLTALAIFDSLTLLASFTTTFSRGIWIVGPNDQHQVVNSSSQLLNVDYDLNQYYWIKKLERRLFLPSANFFSALSVSITVALTIERYIFIKFPMRASSYCSPKYARIIILIIAMLVFLFRLPMYFFSDAIYVSKRIPADSVSSPKLTNLTETGLMPRIHESNLTTVITGVRIVKYFDGVQKYYFLASFILFEITPFFTLSVLNLSLIVLVKRSINELQHLINVQERHDSRRSVETRASLRKSESHYEELPLVSQVASSRTNMNSRIFFGNANGGQKKAVEKRDNKELSVAKRRRDQLKLTRTLIAVVFITLTSEISSIITYDKITEFLIRKFTNIQPSSYMNTLYILQVFISNLITLMLHSTNFFLYCAFNQRYRNTFRQTFRFFFRISECPRK